MRWYILRTLLHKELLRHLANRGGIAMLLLLVVAALLLSVAWRENAQEGLLPAVQTCFVDYWEPGPWIDHLRQTVPEELREAVKFRPIEKVPKTASGALRYPQAAAAIQVRTNGRDANGPRYLVWLWYPGVQPAAVAPYEAWFWQETSRYLQQRAEAGLSAAGPEARAAAQLPQITVQRDQYKGGVGDTRTALATALVLFALFFACVFLMPALACEERERGVLLAQVLSPAHLGEILAARFLFYPALGMGLAALLAGIFRPGVLVTPFFWLALPAAVFGSLGIGLAVASLARTQRQASLGAMCYTMSVTLLLVICQQGKIPLLPWLALEYHSPKVLHAALGGEVLWFHWLHLACAAVLAAAWCGLAVRLFRRRGWQ